MIASLPLHREIMATGSAHIATMPVVRRDGLGAVGAIPAEAPAG